MESNAGSRLLKSLDVSHYLFHIKLVGLLYIFIAAFVITVGFASGFAERLIPRYLPAYTVIYLPILIYRCYPVLRIWKDRNRFRYYEVKLDSPTTDRHGNRCFSVKLLVDGVERSVNTKAIFGYFHRSRPNYPSFEECLGKKAQVAWNESRNELLILKVYDE